MFLADRVVVMSRHPGRIKTVLSVDLPRPRDEHIRAHPRFGQLADKIVALRAFDDDQGKMNRSVAEAGGAVLVVSQFTLLGDCRGGRRPSFTDAAEPAEAERLYLRFAGRARAAGLEVATGVFRAMMKVELVNDGPVTFLLDSRKAF